MERVRRLSLAAVLVTGMLMGRLAFAIDPTELEPAEGYDPGTLNIEQEVTHDHYNGSNDHHKHWKDHKSGYQTTPETTVEYEWTKKLMTGVTVPVDIEKHESTHIGNVDAHVEYTFNPDATAAPVVAVTGRLEAPTADNAKGLGGEAALRLSQKLGGPDTKHQVHAQVSEEYANDAEKGERNGRFAALAGYTYQATPETRLVADLSHEQTEKRHRDANMLELGVKQEVGDNVTLALGGGPGFGPDSPDWRVHAGVGIHFGLGSKK